MDIESLRSMQKDSERVDALYQIMREDSRLNHSKAARVEFITTTTYIEKYLKEGDRILDLGAGAGEYSLYFARKGYEVTAVELASVNIEAFQKKITKEDKIELIHGNALDLSCFAENSFDVVLLFGPLYHISKEEDRQRCIAEAKRVLKPTGTIFIAFILNDMVILTELCYRPDFFLQDSYDHETFKVEDFPFVFFTVEQTREMIQKAEIQIVKEVASDGVSELLEDKINAMDEESYKQYVRYHLYCCEKPEMLGRSNHLLTIGKK